MSSFSQENRILRFINPLKDATLLPERLSGVEGISQLFRFTVDLLAPSGTKIDPADIVGKSATVGIRVTIEGIERFINGIVASFDLCGGDEEFDNYRAVLVPSLWTLTLNTNTRVFANLDAIDVVQSVMDKYNITANDETKDRGPKLEYCTQYRETDFQFISRLLEQHGIFYYFKHTENSHQVQFEDSASTLPLCPIQKIFRYAPEPGDHEGFFDFVVDTISSRSTLVTGKFTGWDHSYFRHSRVPNPLKSVSSEDRMGNNENESYDYAESAAASLFEKSSDSKMEALVTRFLTARRNVNDSRAAVIEGSSNAMVFLPGFRFSLHEHPQDLLNDTYLLTRVEHEVQQLPSFRSRTKPNPVPYSNRFTSVFTNPFYATPMVTPKPRVHGIHTGIVVTPKGEDSQMDNFGRVWVHMWWDRSSDDTDGLGVTAQLRVAQSWAGKGWGTYFWPRVGDEVLIDFIEGDPDQPIVVGSVYNGQNLPKYDPAGQYTLSGILTRSSKDGGASNANELRFEDLKGKEQVFMNAERDYDLHVENTWHTLVGNEQHTTVGSNRFESIGKNSEQTIAKSEVRNIGVNTETTIGENQLLSVGGNVEETIGVDQKSIIGDSFEMLTGGHHIVEVGSDHLMKVANNWTVKATNTCTVSGDQIVNLTAGNEVVIQSDNQICLTGPGGFITIGPAGVIIQGNIVMINSGGVPLPLQPVFPVSRNEKFKDISDPTKPAFPGDDPPSKHINREE